LQESLPGEAAGVIHAAREVCISDDDSLGIPLFDPGVGEELAQLNIFQSKPGIKWLTPFPWENFCVSDDFAAGPVGADLGKGKDGPIETEICFGVPEEDGRRESGFVHLEFPLEDAVFPEGAFDLDIFHPKQFPTVAPQEDRFAVGDARVEHLDPECLGRLPGWHRPRGRFPRGRGCWNGRTRRVVWLGGQTFCTHWSGRSGTPAAVVALFPGQQWTNDPDLLDSKLFLEKGQKLKPQAQIGGGELWAVGRFLLRADAPQGDPRPWEIKRTADGNRDAERLTGDRTKPFLNPRGLKPKVGSHTGDHVGSQKNREKPQNCLGKPEHPGKLRPFGGKGSVNQVLVILNPAARGERAKSLREKIESLSMRIVVRTTNSAGDAEAIAERAVRQGFDTIVAAGGDGTVNEVVNGIAGADVRLGILPVGTMNVFAMEIGIPLNNLQKAWDVIDRGHERTIDLAMANDDYFVQLAGAGLDAAVVQATSPDSKKALGPLSYVVSLAQVAARKPPQIRVECAEGKSWEGCFVLIGNGRYYGGPLAMFKDARLDDGLLDVVVFKNQSHWDALRYVHAILMGSHDDLHDVEYFQTTSLRVTSEDSVPVELDGEVTGHLPCVFSFCDKPLRVLVPGQGETSVDNPAPAG